MQWLQQYYQATTSLTRQVTAIIHPSHTKPRLTIVMTITYAWSTVLYSWEIYIFAPLVCVCVIQCGHQFLTENFVTLTTFCYILSYFQVNLLPDCYISPMSIYHGTEMMAMQ